MLQSVYFWLCVFPALSLQQTTPRAEADDVFGLPPGDCMSAPLTSDLIEWQDHATGSQVTVEWAYGNVTCSSVNSCFGLSLTSDIDLEPQLRPLQIQQNTGVRFLASRKMDVRFSIKPYLVDEVGFRSCDTARGRPVIEEDTDEEFVVPSKFLTKGTNYFIVNTSDPLYNCQFGLRLNITVKPEDCSGVGETVHCWRHGRCVSNIGQPNYRCRCCHGFAGRFCEHVDTCVSAPCANGGTCAHNPSDVIGAGFSCTCPLGYYGNQCENRVENLCDVNPCDNNATCSGNHSNYECHCPHGYSGHHCEINDNNCAQSPCLHGVCVDKVGGYQCFCTPGYGGTNCDREFNECQSNPCKNNGFCVDVQDGFDCQCSRGYRGTDCSIKVDLCNPSPCHNATECVDFGHSFECTCNPGFTGSNCEVNINECASNPCMNDGKCRDVISGYMCLCPPAVSGIHCEYKRMNLPRRPVGITTYKHTLLHHLHVHNLYIVAGTLAGALLIALSVLMGCYCKVHETYRVLCCNNGGYTRHTNGSFREKREDSVRQVANQVTDGRPTMDAILEASAFSYDDSTLNVPLVNSLKPKKV